MRAMKVTHTSPSTPQRPDRLFRCEGDYWTIGYDGVVVRLRDAKGLHYLGQLLHHPGRRFHVGELAGLLRGSASGPRARTRTHPQDRHATERTRKAVTNRIRQAVARIGAAHERLGVHLGNTVHTGGHCTYTPEGSMRWGT